MKKLLLIFTICFGLSFSHALDVDMAVEYRSAQFNQFFLSSELKNKPQAYLAYLKENLQNAKDIKTAYGFSQKITHFLTQGIKDVITMVRPNRGQDYSRYINNVKEALVLSEKFYALNVTGDQEKKDYRFIEDVALKLPKSDNESHKKYLGALAAISIATQEKLWNPKSNIEDLTNITKRTLQQSMYHNPKSDFYVNDRWLYDDKLIQQHVNDNLLNTINGANLSCQVALEECLKADQEKRWSIIFKENNEVKKLYHYPSGGKDNQCGFFSLFLIDDGNGNTARDKFFKMYADYIEQDQFIRRLTLGLLEMEKIPYQGEENSILGLINDDPKELMVIDLLIKNKKHLRPPQYDENKHNKLIEEERKKLLEAQQEMNSEINALKRNKYGLEPDDSWADLGSFDVLNERTYEGSNLVTIVTNINSIISKLPIAAKILKNNKQAEEVLKRYEEIIKGMLQKITLLEQNTAIIDLKNFINFRENINTIVYNSNIELDGIINNEEQYKAILLQDTQNIAVTENFKNLFIDIKNQTLDKYESIIKSLKVDGYFKKEDKTAIDPVNCDIIKKNLEALIFEINIEQRRKDKKSILEAANNRSIQISDVEIDNILNNIQTNHLSAHVASVINLKKLLIELPKIKQLCDQYKVAPYNVTNLKKKIDNIKNIKQVDKDIQALGTILQQSDADFQNNKENILKTIKTHYDHYGLEAPKLDNEPIVLNAAKPIDIDAVKAQEQDAKSTLNDAKLPGTLKVNDPNVKSDLNKDELQNNAELHNAQKANEEVLKAEIKTLIEKIESFKNPQHMKTEKDTIESYVKILNNHGYSPISGNLLSKIKFNHEKKITDCAQKLQKEYKKTLEGIVKEIGSLGYENIIKQMQDQVQKLKEPFDNTGKWQILDKKLLYLLKDNPNLQAFLYEKISTFLNNEFKKTGGGKNAYYAELTMSPRGTKQDIYKKDHPLDFIDAYAHIKHVNVYAFVSQSLMNSDYSWLQGKVPKTEEKTPYHLINHTISDERARDIYIINQSGGHYEKLIREGDYLAIAKAIRRVKSMQ